MDFQKITNFLDTTFDDKNFPRFITKNQIEVYDQSEKYYSVNREITIKTPMLRSDLCNFSDVYIVVKGDITVTEPKTYKSLAFKNNTPYINCISKINGTQIDNVEDLEVVMPIHNLLEYNKYYRKATGSPWNYYRDEPSNPSSFNSESFKYKISITGNIYDVGDGETGYDATKVGKNETEVVIALKRLSNFWESLNIPLNNCEIELILTQSKNCVLVDTAAANNPPTGLGSQIKDTNLHVPVVSLSKENVKKFLEQLKS